VVLNDWEYSLTDYDYCNSTELCIFADTKSPIAFTLHFLRKKLVCTMNEKAVKYTVALCLLLFSSLIAGAERMVSNYGVTSGLSNGYVMSIAQDTDGIIWVATEEGLNRFDGKHFTSFTKENSGLSANELNCVAQIESDPNRLWIATQRDGLCAYDRRSGEITRVESGLLSSDITSIVPASDGGMWLTHYHFGVQYYNPLTGESREYNHRTIPGMPREIWTVAEGNDGRLYVATNHDGLCVVDTASHTMELYRHRTNEPSLPGNVVYSLCFDTSGNLWVGTDKGAALFNPRTQAFTPFVHSDNNPHSIAPGRIRDIKQLGNGEIWFATTQGGVSVLSPGSYAYNDLRNARFAHLSANGEPEGLSSVYIKTIFQDSFGNVWLGNYRSGVDVVSHLPAVFSRINYLSSGTRNVSYKPVWSCCSSPHDGTLWLGGENEIVSVKDGMVTPIELPRSESGSHTFVRTLAVSGDKMLWVGTHEKGVFTFNPATRQFTRIPGSPTDIRAFFEDTDGTMRVGSTEGVYIYRNGVLENDTAINSRLIDWVIHDMVRDKSGNLWIGTFGKGVSVLDKRGELLYRLTVDEGFPSNAVNALHRDSRGRIWAGTRSGLVLFTDLSHPDEFKRIEDVERAGISHVSSIEEDLDGSLWISSSRGIARINPNTLKASIYDGMESMPLYSFMENGSACDDSGRIYFASANGVFSLMPHDLDAAVASQPVRITKFTIFKEGGGREENAMSMPVNSDEITLPYTLNTFRITFNVMDHDMVQRTDLSYSMLGLDDVWIECFGNNEAMYRNLPPGVYKFQVRQRLKGHDWEQPVTVLTVKISPPIWLTWWAKAIYVLIFIGVIIAVALFYKHRVKLKQRLEAEVEKSRNRQKLNDERLRFYTNITHELRTPLTLIMGPLEDMVSAPGLPSQYSYKLQMIRDSSNTLLNLINGILEFRKTETQNRHLTVKKGNLGNLLREIGIRYKELNRNPHVQFVLDIDLNAPDIYYDEEMLTIIVNNLLSNAVKYTPKGTISLSFHTVEENGVVYSEIKVSDTGYGIARNKLARIFDRYYQVKGEHQASGTGIGLALVKNLVDLHEAQISVDSTEGVGSTFTVRLVTDSLYPNALQAESNDKGAADEPELTEHSQADAKVKVLVVEDNDDIREYIRQALVDEFTVLTACNGLEGLKVVQEENPDFVISDIMMPEMDGVSMCRSIKEDILTSHIPVILLTAKDSLRDKEEGYESGADSYLTKPFSAKLLLSRIHNILRLRRTIASQLMSRSGAVAPPEGTVTPPEDEVKEMKEAAKALNPLDRQFMDKINTIINDNLDREDLGVAFLAEQMCMSQSSLYRKLMAIVGVSANEYIRHIRLGKAEEMLREGLLNITEIAFRTGFGSHSSFGKAFKKEYGMAPSEYLKKI
jgi:signal transduction histidine kinase/ligand-binding sensor domain-containing protein/DNA-binding response OmpR family regulator